MRIGPVDTRFSSDISLAGAISGQKTAAVDRQLVLIRVGKDKVYSLANLVGKLVVTPPMLSRVFSDFTEEQRRQLLEGLKQLEHNSRDLQEGVMRIRMVSIRATFRRIPRLVHDLSQKLDKNIELKLSGEQTELDKAVMEKLLILWFFRFRRCGIGNIRPKFQSRLHTSAVF